jgi:maltose alpha-D-glucosyltransferase/alpha-amylase
MDNDRRKIELLNSLLFTLPGAPVLYYGDEIGMGDNISLVDRNGVRTPMQWTSDLNGGFSPAQDLYAPAINDPIFGYRHVNVAAQQADPNSLLHTIRQMILTRKTLPVLASGALEWLDSLPKQALCFWRSSAGQRLLALHNLSGDAMDVEIPTSLSDALNPEAGSVQDMVTLPPYGYRWLVER